MLVFLATSIVAFAAYLLLTLPSGTVGLWSVEELVAGAVLAALTGLIARNVGFPAERKERRAMLRMFNPLRWVLFLVYLFGPFLFAMARANLDVAYRVITGKIRPGIVKLMPELSTDLGRTLMANSITLTPGTLSVDIDEDTHALYVHWINVSNTEPSSREVCGSFEAWARRITE
ncbi:Na+/H+ antiporter subunit E [Candidatus Bipolaricaulota bacterium]|nr:Na+/H+ antiporter subunit E [Candidatus Bipolaricaulota bacterium]